MNIAELTLLRRFERFGMTEDDLYGLRQETVTGTLNSVRYALDIVKKKPGDQAGITLARELLDALQLGLTTQDVLAKVMAK